LGCRSKRSPCWTDLLRHPCTKFILLNKHIASIAICSLHELLRRLEADSRTAKYVNKLGFGSVMLIHLAERLFERGVFNGAHVIDDLTKAVKGRDRAAKYHRSRRNLDVEANHRHKYFRDVIDAIRSTLAGQGFPRNSSI
jgi:hypothetical protein